jgi:hypothetical protein
VNHRPALLVLACLLGSSGCTPYGVPGVTSLQRTWLFGVERMRGDPEPQLPFTNRFIEDLSAMPNVQVVSAADNQAAFSGWTRPKLLVSPWLHGEGNCMNITYTLFDVGQQQGTFGQIIPRMPAGVEPDAACVDRAAAEFYRTLVIQGL